MAYRKNIINTDCLGILVRKKVNNGEERERKMKMKNILKLDNISSQRSCKMKITWKYMIGLVLVAIFMITQFSGMPIQALDASALHDPFKAMFDSDVIIANELRYAFADDLLHHYLDDHVAQMYQEQKQLLEGG